MKPLPKVAGPKPHVPPLVPRYTDMVRKVMDNAGWNPGDFRCLRLIMLYPPMPSTVVMRYPLPMPEGG
jgi:hypothetical protein